MEEIIGQEVIIKHSSTGGVLFSISNRVPLPPSLNLSAEADRKVEARWKIEKVNEFYSIQSISSGRYLSSLKSSDKLDTVNTFSASICSWELRFVDNNVRFQSTHCGRFLHGDNSTGLVVRMIENGEMGNVWWRLNKLSSSDGTPIIEAIEMDKLQITVEVVPNPTPASPITEEFSLKKALSTGSASAISPAGVIGKRLPSYEVDDPVSEKLRRDREVTEGAEKNPTDDSDDD